MHLDPLRRGTRQFVATAIANSASGLPQPSEDVRKANDSYLKKLQMAITTIETKFENIRTSAPIGLGDSVGNHTGTQAAFDIEAYYVAMGKEDEYKCAYHGFALNPLWSTCPGVRYDEDAIMEL